MPAFLAARHFAAICTWASISIGKAYIYSSSSLIFWLQNRLYDRSRGRSWRISRYAKANRKISQRHVKEIASIFVLSFVNKILQVYKRYSYRRDILSKSMQLALLTFIFAKYQSIILDQFAELSCGFLLAFTLPYGTIRDKGSFQNLYSYTWNYTVIHPNS